MSGRNARKMTIADSHWPRHDCVMGSDPAEPVIPGLLSTDGVKAVVPSSPIVDATKEATEIAPQRHILPKNLRHAIIQLSDGELDELFEAAFDEARRRGRLPPSKDGRAPSVLSGSELTTKQSPLNAKRRKVEHRRNLFDAWSGECNSRLVQGRYHAVANCPTVRGFPSNVRKALATDPSK